MIDRGPLVAETLRGSMDFISRRFLNINVIMEWKRLEGSLGCIGSQLSALKKSNMR